MRPSITALIRIALGCWITITGTALLEAQSRPNIVLFIADDLNQQDLGCYGNKEVYTPHVDQLAAEGMRFTRTYAASSMCTPSRAVMFTGLYPHRNGIQMNHFTAKAGIKSLPHFLKALGYRVVISGKVDVSPKTGFPFEVTGEEFGRYEPIENRTDPNKASVKMIAGHFKKNQDQPLCLIVAPWIPHVPWYPHKDFDPESITMPGYLADTRETRSALASYYQSISAMDKMVGEVMEAIDKAGQKDHTVFIFTSDQGAQFPGAKWTTYDKGLRVPFIVRWPGKVTRQSVSNTLISHVDITPTLIDLAGGAARTELDGLSILPVLENAQQKLHEFVFAETSVEPHFWYNYTPARSIIGSDGWHYIRNYHPGVKFVTHIDYMERNEFYFDSWVADSAGNPKTKFLLDRYSYRPPEELFYIMKDREEFNNLAGQEVNFDRLQKMRQLLDQELNRQGETAAAISKGPLPDFSDNNYRILQNVAASHLSFNRRKWNPDTLYITAYLDDLDRGGVICDYFNNFKLFAFENQLGIELPSGKLYQSGRITAEEGQLIFSLTAKGDLKVILENQVVLESTLDKDLTKIKPGYVTCGIIQGESLQGRLQSYTGQIRDLRFTMNHLAGRP